MIRLWKAAVLNPEMNDTNWMPMELLYHVGGVISFESFLEQI